MSLFDDDDDDVDSLSSSSSEHQAVQQHSSMQQRKKTDKKPSGKETDALLDLISATKRPSFDDDVVKPNTINTSTVRMGGTSHFRRTAIGQSPLTAPSTAASAQAEKSVFGNSIAAALQLRKETQQELVWQRLERERAAEQNNTSLIEKDLEVAPFVTPAYQHALRQRRLQKKEASREDHSGEEGRKKRGEEDVDDDPLEKYLQALMAETEQSSAHAGHALVSQTPTQADYYERQMHATLAKEKEDRRQQAEAQKVERETATPSSAPAPAVSIEELQQLVSAPVDLHTSAPTAEPQAEEGQAPTAAAVALETHTKALFVAREARKRRRADPVFVESCAARCNERIYKCFRVF